MSYLLLVAACKRARLIPWEKIDAAGLTSPDQSGHAAPLLAQAATMRSNSALGTGTGSRGVP